MHDFVIFPSKMVFVAHHCESVILRCYVSWNVVLNGFLSDFSLNVTQ